MNFELLKRITIEPGKCGGRPCIRGMRMRVTDVLQLLSAGASHDEIASALGMRTSSLKAMLFRARHKLAALLGCKPDGRKS